MKRRIYPCSACGSSHDSVGGVACTTTIVGTIVAPPAPAQAEGGAVCIDDDCPLPEHTGECPTETLELWRTEAQRARALAGRLLNTVRQRETDLAFYRGHAEGVRFRDITNMVATAAANERGAHSELAFAYAVELERNGQQQAMLAALELGRRIRERGVGG